MINDLNTLAFHLELEGKKWTKDKEKNSTDNVKHKRKVIFNSILQCLFILLAAKWVKIHIKFDCKWHVTVPTIPLKCNVFQTIFDRAIFFYLVENGHKSKDFSFEDHELLYYFKYLLLRIAKRFVCNLWTLPVNKIFYLSICSYK